MKLSLKQEIVCICRMLHKKNYLAATDGNVSVRLGDRLLTTPSGVHKGLMEAEQIITVDLDGPVAGGRGAAHLGDPHAPAGL